MFRIEEGKMRHIHGVAEFMYENAERFGITAKEDMYIIGLLHSIGAIRQNNKDDKDSADILRMINFPQKYVNVIQSNNISPQAYCKNYGVKEDEIPKIQILMWVANMCIDFEGNICNPYDRVEQIENYHEENGFEDTHSARETVDWLKEKGFINE